jgi:hypothetical protein
MTIFTNDLLARIFACRHRRKGIPITIAHGGGDSESYVRCIDCGRRLEFDAEAMRIGRVIREERTRAV